MGVGQRGYDMAAVVHDDDRGVKGASEPDCVLLDTAAAAASGAAGSGEEVQQGSGVVWAQQQPSRTRKRLV